MSVLYFDLTDFHPFKTEGAKRLGEEIREKLLSRLSIQGDPLSKLYSLFHEIDDDGSNKLRFIFICILLLE